MKGAVEHARARFDALNEEVDAWARDARREGKEPWAPPTLVKARDHWQATLRRMVEMQLDAQQHAEPWVVQEARGKDGKRRVRYVPVTGRRFLQEKLLGKGRGVVLMTATPPTAHEVGLDERPSARVTMPLRVPRERRPVVLDYVGSMSLEQRALTLPRMAQAVARHVNGKTIVHAHAHKLARALSEELRKLGVRHVLQDPEDREGSLRAWVRGLEEVFVSVRMNEGLDLRDDLCRTQLLAKMPWPDLGDPWVQARNAHMGEAWMHRDVARSIVQAYGRAIRSEQDWADFVVLDQGFEGFWRRDRELFPAWFREAVGLPKVGAGPA
jgi:Rad3-related DNA helicase